MTYVSRAGLKLEHALSFFNLSPKGVVCADFGSSTGGFVDCLLQHGAEKVYAVETGYGVLDWSLRKDQRVVVMERTNAMHVSLPQKAGFISIDASWTKLKSIIPNALKNMDQDGCIIALLKPHYEAGAHMLLKGKLKEEEIPSVLKRVKRDLDLLGAIVMDEVESPILGEKGKNKEFLLLINRKS